MGVLGHFGACALVEVGVSAADAVASTLLCEVKGGVGGRDHLITGVALSGAIGDAGADGDFARHAGEYPVLNVFAQLLCDVECVLQLGRGQEDSELFAAALVVAMFIPLTNTAEA